MINGFLQRTDSLWDFGSLLLDGSFHSDGALPVIDSLLTNGALLGCGSLSPTRYSHPCRFILCYGTHGPYDSLQAISSLPSLTHSFHTVLFRLVVHLRFMVLLTTMIHLPAMVISVS